MDGKCATRSSAVATVAARQHGVVSLAQLCDAGLSEDAVHARAMAGQLHRMHRGVYAVGHLGLSAQGHWMAAVLACAAGPVGSGGVLDVWGAAISHHSAAELWDLLPARGGPVDVTVPGDGGRRKRTGIRLHRSRTLCAPEVTLRRGIPVTTPSRTLADLSRVAEPRTVRRARRQAEIGRLVEGLAEGPGALATHGTRSDLELDFLAFCRRHRLPDPEVNAKLGPGLTVDFLWRAQKLVVETDDHRYHRGPASFEDDHHRDLRLRQMGFAVNRYTGAQLRGYPAEIAAELGEILMTRPRPS